MDAPSLPQSPVADYLRVFADDPEWVDTLHARIARVEAGRLEPRLRELVYVVGYLLARHGEAARWHQQRARAHGASDDDLRLLLRILDLPGPEGLPGCPEAPEPLAHRQLPGGEAAAGGHACRDIRRDRGHAQVRGQRLSGPFRGRRMAAPLPQAPDAIRNAPRSLTKGSCNCFPWRSPWRTTATPATGTTAASRSTRTSPGR
ncbi:MAG: carboxymuconolactone decarboxylase family protein [Betaproteobacteria bacterium]|nr:carboxymuconolactone decarboxylase family protein [Betaproteobacteria bacterium]